MNDNKILLIFNSIRKKMYKILNNEVKKYDLKLPEAIYLMIINKHESISFKELTKKAECDKGMTTKVMNILKSKNLINAENNIYKVTETGKKISKKLEKIFASFKEKIENNVKTEELDLFYKKLEEINNFLEGEIKC